MRRIRHPEAKAIHAEAVQRDRRHTEIVVASTRKLAESRDLLKRTANMVRYLNTANSSRIEYQANGTRQQERE